MELLYRDVDQQPHEDYFVVYYDIIDGSNVIKKSKSFRGEYTIEEVQAEIRLEAATFAKNKAAKESVMASLIGVTETIEQVKEDGKLVAKFTELIKE